MAECAHAFGGRLVAPKRPFIVGSLHETSPSFTLGDHDFARLARRYAGDAQ